VLILRTREELNAWRANEPAVGFVPTMGALHQGHVSLVEESKRRGLTTISSVFVNPTQFNNASDLRAYPKDESGDIQKLEAAGCDAVFMPHHDEVYLKSTGEKSRYHHQFGALETVYEGAHRPGHFKGVGEVVHILFELVNPTVAFFGEKDYQQLLVIRKLVELIGSNTQIVGMPTVREADGLAMSSRNLRLTPLQRKHATLLHKSLEYARQNIDQAGREEVLQAVQRMFEEDEVMELEYIGLVKDGTVDDYEPGDGAKARGLISAYAGEIRLIDNLLLH